jgi:RHS repeat-associated protein
MLLLAVPALADVGTDRQSAASGNSGRPSVGEGDADALLRGAAEEHLNLPSGQADVTGSGAFTYRIPIEVPPGPKGVEPSLALSYDSQVDRGLAGVGWTLTGLPAVVRIPHTAGVNFDGHDAFAANFHGYGAPVATTDRLIPIGGNKYHTVLESGGEYQPLGICGDGPCAWSMKDGRGNTLYFGALDNGQLWERDSGMGRSARGVMAWGLTWFTDLWGNAWRVTYIKDAFMLYPSRIEWGCDMAYSPPTVWTPPATPAPSLPPTTVVPGDPPLVPGMPGFPLTPIVTTTTTVVSTTVPLLTAPALTPTTPTTSLSTITITLGGGTTVTPAASPAPLTCTGRRQLDFTYEARPDAGAVPYRAAQRLLGIWVSANGQPMRGYQLHYAPSTPTGHSRLVSFQELGSDANPLTGHPAMQFGYNDGPLLPTAAYRYLIGNNADGRADTVSGDFDGDGFDDVVRVIQTSSTRVIETWRGGDPGSADRGLRLASTMTTSGNFDGWRALAADVDGDGRADLVLWHADAGQGGIQVARGGTNGPGAPIDYALNSVLSSLVAALNNTNDLWRLLPGDFNGDQISDLALVNLMTRDVITFPGGAATSTGLGAYTRQISPFGLADYSQRGEPLVADTNGDGISDLVLSYSRWAAMYLIVFPGSTAGLGGGREVMLAPDVENGYAPYQTLAGDFNGDGYGDLTEAYTGSTGGDQARPYGRDLRTWFGDELPGTADSMGMARRAPRDQIIDPNARPSYDVGARQWAFWQHHAGDFDCDGISDVAMYYAGHNGFFVERARSSATGSLGAVVGTLGTTLPTSPIPDGDINVHKWGSRVADLDGDGCQDLMQYYAGQHGSYVHIMRGGLSGLTSSFSPLVNAPFDAETEDTDSSHDQRADSVVLLTPDVNGDGKPDVVLATRSGLRVQLSTPGISDLLISVNNGLGGAISVAYEIASRVPNAIQPGTTSCGSTSGGACGIANNSHRPLVTRVDSNNGVGFVRSKSYSYVNGRYYRGFLAPPPNAVRGERADLSFQEIDATDPNTSVTTRTYYRQDYPFHRRPSEIDVQGPLAPGQGVGALSAHSFSYVVVTPTGAPGVSDVQLTDDHLYTYQLTFTEKDISHHYVHDGYGFITLDRECDDATTCIDNETIWTHDPSRWVMDRVQERRRHPQSSLLALSWEISSYTNDHLTLRQKLLCNDTEDCYCLPTASTCVGNGKGRWIPVESGHQYDAHGKLVSVADALGRLTVYGYDPVFDTYVASITRSVTTPSPASFVEAKTYDGVGRLWQELDYNQQVTTHSYDNLGRQTRIDRPNGGWESWDWHNLGSPPSQYVHHTTAVSVSGTTTRTVWDEQYFDGYGVVLSTRHQAPLSTYSLRERSDSYQNGAHVVSWSHARFPSQAANTVEWTELVNDATEHPSSVNKRLGNGGTLLSVARSYTRVGQEVLVQDNAGVMAGDGSVATNEWHGLTTTYDSRGLVQSQMDAIGSETDYYYDNDGRLEHVLGPYTSAEATAPYQQVLDLAWDGFGRLRVRHQTSSGSMLYTYDDVGNLASSTDARGAKDTFDYDELNRALHKHEMQAPAVTGPVTVTWSYDGAGSNTKGRLTGVADQSGTTAFINYDAVGHALVRRVTVNGLSGTWSEAFAFDLAGRPISRTLPDKTLVSWKYDDGGNLGEVDVANSPFALFDIFDADGRVGRKIVVAPGVESDYTYHPDGGLQFLTTHKGTTSLQQYSYIFDQQLNVRAIKDTRSGVSTVADTRDAWSFGYDGLNRLTSIVDDSGVTTTDGYDARGNLTGSGALVVTYPTGQMVGVNHYCLGIVGSGTCTPIQLTAFTANFDAAGNLTQKTSTWNDQYTYDHDERLTSVTRTNTLLAEFLYDYEGVRAKKVLHKSGQDVTTYYVAPDFEVREWSTSPGVYAVTKRIDGLRYGALAVITTGAKAPLSSTVYAAQGRVLSGDTQGGEPQGSWYLFGNHLGSSSLVTDASGVEVTRMLYAPYGALLSTRSLGLDLVTRKFTGQELDEETGLVYFGARYYDPQLMRFVTPDSALPGGGGNPQGFNRYAYAFDNPVKYRDPSGHDPEPAWDVRYGPMTDENGNELRLPDGRTLRESLAEPEKPQPKWYQWVLDKISFEAEWLGWKISGKPTVAMKDGNLKVKDDPAKGLIDGASAEEKVEAKWGAGYGEIKTAAKDGHLEVSAEVGAKVEKKGVGSISIGIGATATNQGKDLKVTPQIKGKVEALDGKAAYEVTAKRQSTIIETPDPTQHPPTGLARFITDPTQRNGGDALNLP